MLSIRDAAAARNCTQQTIRNAIKRGQLTAKVLNPEDAPQRHVVRIVENKKWRDWQKGHRRK